MFLSSLAIKESEGQDISSLIFVFIHLLEMPQLYGESPLQITGITIQASAYEAALRNACHGNSGMDGAARAGTPGGAGGAWVRGGDNGT